MCLCSATLNTSGATGGNGGVVISMWFLVGIDNRHGICGLLVWFPLTSAAWLPEEALEEPSAYNRTYKIKCFWMCMETYQEISQEKQQISFFTHNENSKSSHHVVSVCRIHYPKLAKRLSENVNFQPLFASRSKITEKNKYYGKALTY